jgi:anti-sigma-K factor RskA
MSLEHEGQALASYIVGALPPDERASLEAHLAQCAECAAEARSLQRVADAMARSVPQRTPRPELRARVLEAVGASGRVSNVRAQHRPVRSAAMMWLPLAAMLVLAVGLGAYTMRLQERIASLESSLEIALTRAASAERATSQARRVIDETQSAMGVLAAPDLARIDLKGEAAAPGASARALWSRQRGMVFTVSNLPAPPAGRVYQVWVVTAQAPVSAGLLQLDATGRDMRVFQTPPDIAAPVAVAVTLEPEGGVPAPTGQRYLMGTPGPAI